MKLYYAPGACSMATRIGLYEIGRDAEFERVDLRTKRTESGADYREINPLGYVPALEVDGGDVVTENTAILPYVASLGGDRLGATGDALGRARLDQVLGFLSSELHKAFGPFFGQPQGAERDAALAKLETRIDHVERLLGQSEYLLEDRFTIADAYAFVVLSWSRMFDISLDRWPRVKGFVDRMAQRPSVERALQDEGLLEPAAA